MSKIYLLSIVESILISSLLVPHVISTASSVGDHLNAPILLVKEVLLLLLPLIDRGCQTTSALAHLVYHRNGKPFLM